MTLDFPAAYAAIKQAVPAGVFVGLSCNARRYYDGAEGVTFSLYVDDGDRLLASETSLEECVEAARRVYGDGPTDPLAQMAGVGRDKTGD